ncbi:hypothetical protein PR202_ga12436 [Eleusine coracana subsp. coracana]|uniref:Uncharacterized protein n=1 Tax=Eleusine coracana subsp. coracana TaxID=191504 RepID=A0AAV5CBI8_ELECO|nr:hypothetical protein PR202_ga12436 [Eleusine coracana subsp. coracana]
MVAEDGQACIKEEEEGHQLCHHPRSLGIVETQECVFDNTRLSTLALLHAFKQEQHIWCLAWARGLRALDSGHGDRLG